MLEYTNVLREKGRSNKRNRDTLTREVGENGERRGVPKSTVCIMEKSDAMNFIMCSDYSLPLLPCSTPE